MILLDNVPPPKPLIRWAGSKKRLAKDLLAAFPKTFEKYFEPFCGSACMYFALKGKTATLSDINTDLMNFYAQAAKNPSEVYRRFTKFPRSSESYYEARTRFQSTDDLRERASIFYFLNRNCFNGIFRTNQKGHFNVPFSSSRVPKYPTEQEFINSARHISLANRLQLDFEEVCAEHVSQHDFVYLDPPYYVSSKRVFREYSSQPFEMTDIDRVRRVLRVLDKRGAKFLLSYPACSDIEPIALDWSSSRVTTIRSIAANKDARMRQEELFIRNY